MLISELYKYTTGNLNVTNICDTMQLESHMVLFWRMYIKFFLHDQLLLITQSKKFLKYYFDKPFCTPPEVFYEKSCS